MPFASELKFEAAVIDNLVNKCAWSGGVLKNPSEKDLIENWKNILFQNNRGIDRLNNYPLTDTEMQQILDHIESLQSPVELNGFINGRVWSIKRDNPEDKAHYGKEVTLKIYDRNEIAAGSSVYQIAEQPILNTPDPLDHNRRGDFMLLINGMPVIHCELKRSGVPVIEACNQIQKYYREGVYYGIYRLIQIFVAMNPEETVYFANPGSYDKFDPKYYFHWADKNNDPINDWDVITEKLLSIPMAHTLVGFYTVADKGENVLKVLRSYQYYAATGISDKVSKTTDWFGQSRLGGYIWHTTGSGKTLTSFKAAQLIADSGDADKVIFLIDRIELGNQSFDEYSNFAQSRADVNQTEDTASLISFLRDDQPKHTLIVTSIQKMSRIKVGFEGVRQSDLDLFANKRIVIIEDECHRSTFGDMLIDVKQSFPKAMFFGFTGTPITMFHLKGKGKNTTTDLFGPEIHRYTLADGIRDKNVLGFDVDMVTTFRDADVRKKVALVKAHASSEEEALRDPYKAKIYNKYMDSTQFEMAYPVDENGKAKEGIESWLNKEEYRLPEHQKEVVKDIADNWKRIQNWYESGTSLSKSYRFHGIFATSSIAEACQYYHLIRNRIPDIKVTVLVDPNDDNLGGKTYPDGTPFIKNEELKTIISDYNAMYGTHWTLPTMADFKVDVSHRLAHKDEYEHIAQDHDKQLDLLIVVDQMLTGFDSKWIIALYLDKVLEHESLIQAFSRTNRLCGDYKPNGVIRYYRCPHQMHENIKAAVKEYSGDKVPELFVSKLEENLNAVNHYYDDIVYLFTVNGVLDFSKLPDDVGRRREFRKVFRQMNEKLYSAKCQGFHWGQLTYCSEETGNTVTLKFDQDTYEILLQRYKELPASEGRGTGVGPIPLYLEGNSNALEDMDINADYMNKNFDKWRKILQQPNVSEEEKSEVLTELHHSFMHLSQEDQKFANLILHDIDTGTLIMKPDKSFSDYIVEYKVNSKNRNARRVSEAFGVDIDFLILLCEGKFELSQVSQLEDTINWDTAHQFFAARDGQDYKRSKLGIIIHEYLMIFIESRGTDVSFLGDEQEDN